MKRQVIAIACVMLLVTLAGCSFFDEAPALETTIDSDIKNVHVGEEFVVSATVSNTGSAAGEQTLDLYANGDVVDSTTVTVEPDQTKTVELSYIAEDSGEHTLQLDGTEMTVTAYPPSNAVKAAMANTSTYVAEEQVHSELVASDIDFTLVRTETTSGRYDLTSRQAHIEKDSTLIAEALDLEIETQGKHRYADDILYIQEHTDTNKPAYRAHDEPFSSVAPITDFDVILNNLPDEPTEVTADSITYSINTDEAASDVYPIVTDGQQFREEEITEFTMTVTVDPRTYRISGITIDLTTDVTQDESDITPDDANMTRNITYNLTLDNYNSSVLVETPDNVISDETEPTPLTRVHELGEDGVVVEAISMDTASEIIVELEGQEQARLTEENKRVTLSSAEVGDEIKLYADGPDIDEPIEVKSTTVYAPGEYDR